MPVYTSIAVYKPDSKNVRAWILGATNILTVLQSAFLEVQAHVNSTHSIKLEHVKLEYTVVEVGNFER